MRTSAQALLVGALLSLPPRAAQEKPAFEAVIQRAVEAEREGRLEEAESAFEEAARLRPDHPRVHYSLAWVRLQRGLATEALAAVNQALALDPEESLFYLLKGEIFITLGNLAEAEDGLSGRSPRRSEVGRCLSLPRRSLPDDGTVRQIDPGPSLVPGDSPRGYECALPSGRRSERSEETGRGSFVFQPGPREEARSRARLVSQGASRGPVARDHGERAPELSRNLSSSIPTTRSPTTSTGPFSTSAVGRTRRSLPSRKRWRSRRSSRKPRTLSETC